MRKTETFYYERIIEEKEKRKKKIKIDGIYKKETKASVHHIYPQSRGGSNEDNNLIVLDDDLHKRIHALFENQTPSEQIINILNWNSRAIKKEIRDAILQILLENGEEIYNNRVKK